MKKYILIIVAIISIYCIACKDKKVEPQYDIAYLDLRYKPLDTIKSYIKGKWQVRYVETGWGGKQYKRNTFIEFIFNVPNNDSINYYNDTTTYANTKVYFTKSPLYVGGRDSSYIINFNLYGYTTEWYTNSIINDTLQIWDNFDDGGVYFLTRDK